MKIDFNRSNGELTIALDGRLDSLTAPVLEDFLAGQYAGATSLTFDFAKLAYVSSAGLRVLLTAHKRMKGAMKLTNISELIMEILEVTGFADVWEIA